MDSLDRDYASQTFRVAEPPCLSLYQPTHRSYPDNQQDPIRFRNLVRALEESLGQKYSSRDAQPLLEPFRALVDNRTFWNHALDGLAILAAPDRFRVYRLQRPVPELTVVADSFHIKPLLRILQSADRFHVLGLNRQEVLLFEGNRDVLDPVELPPEFPRTITEALGEGDRERHLEVWTAKTHVTGAGVRHGTSAADVVDSDTERFFRAVDRAVLEHYSRPSGLPLLLAALPENQSVFQRVSRNSLLISEGIEVHPESLSIDELRARAWQVLEPHYLARLAGLVEMFGAAQVRELGSADLAQVARAALAGRVATLLIEAERHISGRIDGVTGEIEFAGPEHPWADDLLDDLGELVLSQGGQVVIVPAERMPTTSGIAAIYRY